MAVQTFLAPVWEPKPLDFGDGRYLDNMRNAIRQRGTEKTSATALDPNASEEEKRIAMAKLLSINPDAHDSILYQMQTKDQEQKAAQNAQLQQFGKVSAVLSQLSGEDQVMGIQKELAAAQDRGDDLMVEEMSELLGMDEKRRDIELRSDAAATELGLKILGQFDTDTSPVKLGEGDTLVDPTTGKTVASNADGLKAREVAVKEGQLKLDQQEFKAAQAKVGGPMDDKALARAEKLQGKFIQQSGNFTAMNSAIGKLRSAAADDSGPGDVALIFGFMKLNDPISTVREGEFATAENSSGVSESIRNMYNKAITGERMTPKARANMLSTGENLYSEADKQHRRREKNFRKQAKTQGLNPDFVTIEMRTTDAQGQSQLPQGVTEADIEATMAANNMTREQVLERLRGG